MTWATATLGQVCEVVSGATPRTGEKRFWGGDVLWTTPKDLSDLQTPYLERPLRTITDEGLRSCAASLLPSNSVLLSSRAPIGLVAINSQPMATNQGFKSFVPDSRKLDSKFLYYWLKSKTSYLQGLGNGATFKEISKAVVERIEIPLPPLDEQRRIAAILDKADALRRKRKRAVDLLDSLTQSIFLEMFGDPRGNTMAWPKRSLQQLGTVHTGKTPPTSEPRNFGNDVPFLTPADLESGSPPTRFVSTLGATFLRAVSPGAALVCCIGATIGKMDIAGARSTFNQQINAVEWNQSIVSEFGIAALRFCKNEIVNRALSTTLPILKKSEFQKIEIVVPPMNLQRDFSNRAQRIARLRLRVVTGASGLDSLFSSLQHRAFSGQL